MQLNVFKEDKQKECIHIYYNEMTPLMSGLVERTKKLVAHYLSGEMIEEQKVEKQLSGKSIKGETVFLNISDVFYFESVDKKVFVYMRHEVFEINDSLNEIENSLYDQGFIRINKSNIVNINYIAKIVPEVNMRVRAVLENKEYLMINRSYKKEFVKFLKERRKLS